MNAASIANLFIRVPCEQCGVSVRINSVKRHTEAHDLFSRVDASGDCWEWTGEINAAGYGIAYPAKGTRMAHRLVWEKLVGPIPEGLTLDHLCRNRVCVNPDHLEPVTQGENTRRGFAPTMRVSRSGTCSKGHPTNRINTWTNPATGRRRCRVCHRETQRRYVARRAA